MWQWHQKAVSTFQVRNVGRLPLLLQSARRLAQQIAGVSAQHCFPIMDRSWTFSTRTRPIYNPTEQMARNTNYNFSKLCSTDFRTVKTNSCCFYKLDSIPFSRILITFELLQLVSARFLELSLSTPFSTIQNMSAC